MINMKNQKFNFFANLFSFTLKWINKNMIDTNPKIKPPVEITVLPKNR